MYIRLHLQLKRFKKGINVPTIRKTPGPYDGAQFDFFELFKLHAEQEVGIIVYIWLNKISSWLAMICNYTSN